MNSYHGVRQVFFDLDGTLVDSFPGIEFSARAAMAEVLPDRASPDFRPFIGPPIREIFRRALDRPDEPTLGRLEAAFRQSYDHEGWLRTTPYPGVRETLRQLSGHGLTGHVLTNKPRPPTLRILQHLELVGFFAEIITPEFRSPPYATKLEAALDARRRLGLAGGDAVVVGDSPDDAAAAAGCGFGFVAVTFGYGGVHRQLTAPGGHAPPSIRPPGHVCIDDFSQLFDHLAFHPVLPASPT